jgi:membrane protease YdiL (CAAX protease family)
MNKMKHLIRKYPLLSYFILVFVLTWGSMALAAYPGGFPISEAQFDRAGAMIYLAMLVGPAGAAIMMTALVDGRAGFRQLRARLTKWRVGTRWVAAALLTAPLLILALLFGLTLLSNTFQPAIFGAENKLAALFSAGLAGLAVGFFEELGWTGFAVPRLRRRTGFVTTGLIVGFVWGAWHFPPFWNSETFSAPLPLAILLGQLFSWLPPFRILMVWVYDQTESLLIAVLMHASLMASLTALVPADLSGAALLTWILTWAAVLWVIVVWSALYSRKLLSQQAVQSEWA